MVLAPPKKKKYKRVNKNKKTRKFKPVRKKPKAEPLDVSMTTDIARSLIGQMSQDQILEEVAKEDPVLWLYRHVPTETGDTLSFDRRPYLIDILRDFHPHLVFKKSAQVGITQCVGVGKLLYVVDKIGLNTIYTFPTATNVNEFSKARFRPIVHNSRYLSARIGSVDSASLVRIGNSSIYFKGTFAEKQAISVPSQLNVHDELDFSDENVRDVYSSRLDAAEFNWEGEMQYGWEWDFSTPTLPKFGISALFDTSDQKEWMVKCTGCNHHQVVDFFKNLRKTRRGRAFYGCVKCDKELDRTNAQWVPKYPDIERRSGYHITQPMVAYKSAQQLSDTWDESQKDPQKKRKFYNFNLGLDYEDGTEGITEDLVKSRIVAGITEAGPLFIGVDQADILHYEVTKVVGGRRRIIQIGELYSFDELDEMMYHYEPRICVLDATPNHHNAKELAEKHHNLYLCYYVDNNRLLEREQWQKDMENDKSIKVNRTDLLDKAVSEWTSSQILIEDYIPSKQIDEFARQMSNMKRQIVEDAKYRQKAKWVRVDDDHFRHADAYNWAAMEIGSAGQTDAAMISEPDRELAISENLFTLDEVW